MAWQKIKIEIPPEIKPADRIAISEEIIEHIISRTESGVNRHGNDFPGYSQSYKTSLDFKIAGKNKNKVNLTLSGDMLASLKLLKSKPGELVIGYDKNSEENDIAEGNILGSYGGSPKKSRARDFLGIYKKDVTRIIKEVL